MTTNRGLKKYSVRLSGHATSVTLEPIFWDALTRIWQEKSFPSLQALIEQVDQNRKGNLSSALRIFVVENLLGKIKTL